MTAKVRRMAGEFQSQFNEAMREAELDEIRKQVEGVNQSVASLNTTTFNPLQPVRDELKGAIVTPAPAPAPALADASPVSGPLPAPPPDQPPAIPASALEAPAVADASPPETTKPNGPGA